jgi:hypothetical protein
LLKEFVQRKLRHIDHLAAVEHLGHNSVFFRIIVRLEAASDFEERFNRLASEIKQRSEIPAV